MAVGGLGEEEEAGFPDEDVVGRLDEDEAVVRDDEVDEEGREVGAEEDRV